MRTAPTSRIAIAVLLLLGLLAGVRAAGQADKQGEALLQAAKNTAFVKGDLKAAIEEYEEILARPDVGRTVAARALLEMGQCYEKLGQKEARDAYERIVRQYADQTEQVQAARTRLASLGGGVSKRSSGGEMTVRRLWSDTNLDTSGEPSPDGRYLSTSDASIYPAIRNLETGQTRRFIRKDNWSSVMQIITSRWSPDGKNIAFGLLNRDMSMETWIVGMDDREPRMLAPGVPLDWSKDGKFILALTGKLPAPPLMALLSVRDGSVNTLSTADNPVWSWSATLTPDGKNVIYDFAQQDKAQARDVFLISANSKEVTPLVKHPADDRALGWVPGTDVVLFSSTRAGAQDVWALHVTNGTPQGEPILVRQGLGQIAPMGFADRGDFFYSVSVGITEIYEGALDLAKGAIVEHAKKIPQRVVGTSQSPEWSPDGKYIAYVSQRGAASSSQGAYVLCIRRDNTTEERELPLAIQSFWQLHWAADGKAVFATAANKENQGVFKFDIQSGKPTIVALSAPGSIVKTFAVAPDSKSVFYGKFQWEKKELTIVRHDLDTGQEEEVYHKLAPAQAPPPDITGLAISPDGKFLSYCTIDTPADQTVNATLTPANIRYAIRILPAAGGQTRDLLSGRIQEWAFPVWAEDGKALLFGGKLSDPKETKREIWRVPVDGGEPQRIPSDLVGRDIRLHPDGRRLVFTSGSMLREIWVMENFLTQKQPS